MMTPADSPHQKQPLLRRVEDAMFKPKARLILFIVTLVLGIIGAALFATFYVACERNDLLLHEDGKALREEILRTGETPTFDSYYVEQISMRSVDLVEKKVTLDGQEYRVVVTRENISSDWLNINASFFEGDYRIIVGLESCFCIDMELPQPYGITATGSIQYNNTPEDWSAGTVRFFVDINGVNHDALEYSASFDYDHLDFPLKNKMGSCYEEFTPEFTAEISGMLRKYYLKVFEAMPEVLKTMGVNDTRALWENKIADKNTIIVLLKVGEFYVLPLTLCSFSLCLLLFIVLRLAVEKSKAKHLLSESETLVEAVEPAPLPLANRGIELIRKSKIKPCITEWILRAIGLTLMFSCTLYVGLMRLSDKHGWALGFGEFGSNLFQSFYAAGQLTLIVVVVIIIAETRRNLAHFTALFFSLGLGYYVMMTGLVYAITHLFAGDNTVLLSYIFQFELPGNLFFGVGIFTFLGFFLFAKPEEAFIKAKTMRLLSLLPVALAIGSIVISALMQNNNIEIPYYVSNLFFVKDPTFLIAGIGLEYVIFAIRRYCERKYGASARNIERLPEMQILKNLALCGMVLFLSLLTYLIPVNSRLEIGLSCKYSISFLLIPLFLFMKPSGEGRNHRLDWLYYLLFIITSTLPTIITYADQIFFA